MKNYAKFIVKNRYIVLVITLLITAFLLSKIKSLNIVVNVDDLLPNSHPYVQAQKDTFNHIIIF